MSSDDKLTTLLEQWEASGRKLDPAELCADCPEMEQPLREAIARILRAEAALSPLTLDADDMQPDAPAGKPFPALQAPKQIGPYHILGPLGSGGFGEVYKAEQRSPIRRTVAIKIIKLGFDSREVIARFESERQALARMDHPHVARVLDAGVSDTGRPYFVMEYVPGKPITQFCDDNKMSIKDRLLLFTQACEAISHAHTKAIIHRDIKAANVLAFLHDGKPTVKAIDFGIAKALTGDRLTDATFNTDAGRIIGTYDSMSPEQAAGDPDIDTRTDVYSLGVLLYELLTGAKPFDHNTLARAADDEIKRIIREVEPPRPSTRLSELGESATKLATLRQSKLDALAKQLRSELEWIPLKAMRKERARRYASPIQIREDIHKYLDGQPLIAGPENRPYRWRKFLVRNRAAVLTCATLVLFLVGGAALYARSIRAEQRRVEVEQALSIAHQDKRESERRRVEVEKQKEQAKSQGEVAAAVSDFLTNRVLAGARPERLPDMRVRDAIVQTMLDPAAAAVVQDFKDKPLIEAAVRDSLTVTYLAIGRADRARPHAAGALEIRRRLLGEMDSSTIRSMRTMATVEEAQGKLGSAESLFSRTLDLLRQLFGEQSPDVPGALTDLGRVLSAQGKLKQAEPLTREALNRSRYMLGEDHPDTLNSLSNLGYLLQSQGKLSEAEPLYREALKRRRSLLGDDHPDTLMSINNLGYLLQSEGKWSEAELLSREALERSRRVLGDDHPDTLRAIGNMASLLRARGTWREAEGLFREAPERSRRVLGEDHPDTLRSINNMVTLLGARGTWSEAEPLLREALERSRRVLGDDHPDSLMSLHNYARVLDALGRSTEAEPMHKQALERCRSLLGPKHPQTKRIAANYANCLDALGRTDEATALRREFELPEPTTQAASAPTSGPSTGPTK